MELARPHSESQRGRAKPRSGSGPIISLVNGIWADQRFSLKHSFKQLAEDVYKAKSQSVDFNQVLNLSFNGYVW